MPTPQRELHAVPVRTQRTEQETVVEAAMIFREMGLDRETAGEIVDLIEAAKSPAEKAAIIRAVSDGQNAELEQMAADLEAGNVHPPVASGLSGPAKTKAALPGPLSDRELAQLRGR